ncbi:MAG: aminopeptidase [Oscillospiraceae bacterium]|jgi:aminopeptidase|nr:aminopeptidase [Oscillospiraceae bacterium]
MNEQFARLAVNIGANVQKGGTLVLSAPVECAGFARLIAEAAYEAGAREVVTRWSDDAMARLKYLKADGAVFDEFPRWMKVMYDEFAGKKAALLTIHATDPELLKDADPDRITRWGKASGTALKPFFDKQMANEFAWCIVSMPTPSWARRVFPGLDGEAAVDALWNAIEKATRLEGDAVANWREHLAVMERRAAGLTDYNFKKIRYLNGLGTDLTVELPDNHKWIACGEKTKDGVPFVANMPSEEIFTLPKKDGVNGVLYSSMPLSLNGNIVDGMRFTFKDGRIVDAQAEKGLEYLRNELNIDEGARYLGEAALVPHNSPISNLGILFYNTLFDENASCHFAFGKAYPCFRDAETAGGEVMKARGMNDSLTHTDFMVGTADLSIVGTTQDGREIPVFVNGNFAE